MKLKLFITLLLLAVMPAFAQNTGVSGVVVDADSGQPIAGATVLLQQGSSAFTGPNGDFRISAAHTGDETLTVIAYGYKDIVTSVAIDSHSVTNLGTLKMAVDKSIATSTDMAVLDENQIEDEEGNDQSIGMLAGASDDVYYNAASYDFSVMRFRLRGYAQEYSQMYVNGVHLTDAIRGRFNYSSFGGMNQAFKSKAASIGLTPSNYTLGEIGGSTNVNTLASNYAPGFRGSVSYTNGAYTMRGMVTYSTGLKENGWAFTLSAVGRYSKEGITEGTFYNSAGLFLSLQKVFNANHSLGITLYGAPTRRGGSSATYEEAYVGQRGHGLCTAGLEDLGHTGGGGGGKDDRIHPAVLSGGGGHHDLRHARDLGRDDIHQHGGGIGRRAAGHIYARLFNGGIFLAQHDAGLLVDHEVLMHLLAVEALNIGGSLPQGLKEIGGHIGKGLIDLRLRHLQVVDLCPVKFQRVLLQCLIAPGADLGNDAVHHILHVFLRADVPVQDLLGPELIKIIQLDHFVSSCKVLRSASSMASISLCLNW